jgi:hypothetical protein
MHALEAGPDPAPLPPIRLIAAAACTDERT